MIQVQVRDDTNTVEKETESERIDGGRNQEVDR